MALHPDLTKQKPEPNLKGSVTFRAGDYQTLQDAMKDAIANGATFGKALKTIGTMGVVAWAELTHEEQATALGLRPY